MKVSDYPHVHAFAALIYTNNGYELTVADSFDKIANNPVEKKFEKLYENVNQFLASKFNEGEYDVNESEWSDMNDSIIAQACGLSKE